MGNNRSEFELRREKLIDRPFEEILLRQSGFWLSSLRKGERMQLAVKVLFFAQSRESTGCGEHLLKVDRPLTESEFWAALIDAFPSLASLQKSARLARSETYLHKDEMLQPNDEIAIIPPVSGG